MYECAGVCTIIFLSCKSSDVLRIYTLGGCSRPSLQDLDSLLLTEVRDYATYMSAVGNHYGASNGSKALAAVGGAQGLINRCKAFMNPKRVRSMVYAGTNHLTDTVFFWHS